MINIDEDWIEKNLFNKKGQVNRYARERSGLSLEELYVIYHKLENIPVCPICSSKVRFLNFYKGFNKTCSKKCAAKLQHEKMTPEEKIELGVKISKGQEHLDRCEMGRKTWENLSQEEYEQRCNNNSKALNRIEDNGKSVAQNRADRFQDDDEKLKRKSEKIKETRKINGINSVKKFWDSLTSSEQKIETKKRAKKSRITKEQNGNAIPLKYKDDYNIYFRAASFRHGFNTSDKEQLKLLAEHGVFNNFSNTRGCVRDHLLSRRYGFENNISTWIISHPANCEIVLHTENTKRSRVDDNIITIEELMLRIKNW